MELWRLMMIGKLGSHFQGQRCAIRSQEGIGKVSSQDLIRRHIGRKMVNLGRRFLGWKRLLRSKGGPRRQALMIGKLGGHLQGKRGTLRRASSQYQNVARPLILGALGPRAYRQRHRATVFLLQSLRWALGSIIQRVRGAVGKQS